MTLHRKIINYVLYFKWTACRHLTRKPVGYYGHWICQKCGAKG
jgi:hypothetical protein